VRVKIQESVSPKRHFEMQWEGGVQLSHTHPGKYLLTWIDPVEFLNLPREVLHDGCLPEGEYEAIVDSMYYKNYYAVSIKLHNDPRFAPQKIVRFTVCEFIPRTG
jgi:hypothetical protein